MTNKKYILIQNDGEIESNSFELIGASTKRDEKGKIGFFGSGLKYSIAYMMRKGIEFRIFSGTNELTFSTQPEGLRDKSFDRICINGRPTSYTTTMGPTWTEDWFVLREIYCNALDESNCQLIKDISYVSPSTGKTRIFIELTDTLKEVVACWDKYFSDERTPVCESEKVYTSHLGSDDGSQETYNYQKVSVFDKTDGVLFRKGIRVGVKARYAFDYGIEFVNINEDRTAKDLDALSYLTADLMGQFPSEAYVKSVLRTAQDDNPCTEYMNMSGSYIDQTPSEKWVDFSQRHMLVVKEISGRFSEEVNAYKGEVFLIPSFFARNLKKKVPAISIVGMGEVLGDVAMSMVERTPKMDFLLKEVMSALSQMGYEVNHPITIVEFDSDKILGRADIKNKKIYLSRSLFDKGRREIAMTLIEETEHIRSVFGDKTREFQNHLFSSWLKSMEEANGLFL